MTTTRSLCQASERIKGPFWVAARSMRTYRAIGSLGVLFGAPTACRRRRIWLPGLPRPRENMKKEQSREKEKEREREAGARTKSVRETEISAVFAVSRFSLIIRTS